jgi:hypothetical protein
MTVIGATGEKLYGRRHHSPILGALGASTLTARAASDRIAAASWTHRIWVDGFRATIVLRPTCLRF